MIPIPKKSITKDVSRDVVTEHCVSAAIHDTLALAEMVRDEILLFVPTSTHPSFGSLAANATEVDGKLPHHVHSLLHTMNILVHLHEPDISEIEAHILGAAEVIECSTLRSLPATSMQGRIGVSANISGPFGEVFIHGAWPLAQNPSDSGMTLAATYCRANAAMHYMKWIKQALPEMGIDPKIISKFLPRGASLGSAVGSQIGTGAPDLSQCSNIVKGECQSKPQKK